MPITQSLSALALRHLLPPANEAAAQIAAAEAADRVVGALVRHLSDHSQRLPQALCRACRNAWKALELALAGDSWWQRCRALLASADQRAFGRQVEAFLGSNPLPGLEGGDAFRRACQRELADAR